jgi:phosphotransferase system IIB component
MLKVRSGDARTTRLRLLIASEDTVDVDALRQCGVRGFVRPSAEELQGDPTPIAPAHAPAPTAAPPLQCRTVTAQTVRQAWRGDATALPAALGGSSNVREITLAGAACAWKSGTLRHSSAWRWSPWGCALWRCRVLIACT